MSSFIVNALVKALKSLTKDLEKGNFECSEEEMESALDELAKFNSQRHMSKESACMYLDISRATFDNLVREGKIPKGEKALGFKELGWKKSDLDKVLKDLDL